MAHQTLSLGSRGPEVVTLQDDLNALPTDPPTLSLDGVLGPRTKARVQEFQQQNGLEPDGIVGRLSWAELDQPPRMGSAKAGRFFRSYSASPGFADRRMPGVVI